MIEAVSEHWMELARARQLQLTKPPESLGRLEEIANRMAAIQQTLSPSAARARIIVFAGNHGVCAEGVNPYPQEVTAQMVANFRRGGAAINALARVAGAELEIVNMARTTKNFCEEPAMSRDETLAAIETGRAAAVSAHEAGCQLIGLGEMGIGNTTSAAALTAALTGSSPQSVVGRGTGADDACLARKLSAVERGLALHFTEIREPLDALACLGGFEIAAMCGACLGGAELRCAVIVDGFISTAAAAVAVKLEPNVRDYLFPAHASTEPGHRPLLELIGHRPLLDMQMRLGEGTGAALAIPIVRAAVAAFTEMATFDSAGVSDAHEAVS